MFHPIPANKRVSKMIVWIQLLDWTTCQKFWESRSFREISNLVIAVIFSLHDVQVSRLIMLGWFDEPRVWAWAGAKL